MEVSVYRNLFIVCVKFSREMKVCEMTDIFKSIP